MGMGAAKPGSTFRPTVPPQGGKGGGRPMPPQGGKGTVQQPGQPQVPMAGGKAPGVVQPGQSPYTPIGLPPSQVPAQGGKGNMPLPADYQSRYGNYGFDSGLQNYLDQQYVGSTRDAGVGYQYDPSTQTFTGGTMAGQYNPIPLSVMQQAAAGNRDVLNPYFQSKFPQQPAPVMPAQPQRDLGYGIPPPRPQVFPAQPQVMPRPVPQVMPRQPTPKPAPQVMPRGLAGLRRR
jgi:hypothetical protein